ncbi:MAG: NADH-quinone oxidoreductase subunit H [Coriobacteriia bacterium]|nr:NADH-quinone oxidoreductase subunit H [Coriobacteriia bacterium]
MNPWATGILHTLLLIVVMLLNGSLIIYMLRKVLGHLHLRLGPTELGPGGILQLVPDIVKLLVKEDRHPGKTDRWLYIIAPVIVFVPALMAYIAIPFSDKLIGFDVNLGVLMLFGFLTVIPLGIFAAGWGSHNKYALIGATRAVGGAISYEIPLLLSALIPIMLTGSFSLKAITMAQTTSVWYWLPAFPAMIIFFICSIMETNQSPFDMSEAESELVSGFNTEYSAMRFGFMYLAEFSNNFIMAAIMVSLFFGGWSLPFINPNTMGAFAPIVFIIKTYLVIFAFMFIRGTFSRYRVDQMLAFGWKKLMPIALVYTVVVAFFVKLISMKTGGGL